VSGSQNPQENTLMTLLTPKQFRVVLLVARGCKNSQVAEILGTSEHVVKNLLKDIFDRAGVFNRTELSLRYVHESSHQMYNRDRLANEFMELFTREVQLKHSPREDQVSA
jgi:DNA-binding CsgD family transcriptional regulator